LQGLLARERGSLTLEATIVFPLFLALMLVLINCTRVAMVYVAMDHAVSETVKQIAAESYAFKLLQSGSLKDLLPLQNSGPRSGGEANGDVAGGNPTGVISSISKEVEQELLAQGDKIVGTLLKNAIEGAARRNIKRLYPLGGLEDEEFCIALIKVYDPGSPPGGNVNGVPLDGDDIALVVRYTVKIPVPFIPCPEISLSNTAVERAWVDEQGGDGS